MYAVYTRALGQRIPELARAGRLRLEHLSRLAGFRVVDLGEHRWQARLLSAEKDPGVRTARLQRLFLNVNTLEDYQAWLAEM